MILQALVKRYEDLLKKGAISEPGWGKANVSFGLNLNSEGEVISLLSLKTQKESGKKTVFAPQPMEVPQPVKRSVDIKANFLCDNSTYILGIDEKGKKERVQQCFCACRELHIKLLQNAETEAAPAIIRFFEKWNPEEAQGKQYISDNWKDLMAGANILFFYDGKSVMENPVIKECWRDYYNNSDSGGSGICMVTGQKAPIAVLHPTIKGVRGAQAMGTSLVSFNSPSFCSYGKEQGTNAPVSEYAAFAYGTALNELLNDREHTKAIGDTTVVCWAEGGEAVYQDIAMAALFGTEEDGLTEQDLSMILSKIQKGDKVRFKDEWLSPDRHFYILGLAPNAARLSVRFFMEDSFGEIVRHIQEHYERLEIVRPSYDKFTLLPIWALLSETTRDKSPSPQMAADTLKAVLSGGTYPASLLNGVMLRIRAERKVTSGRAAIIKAYYLRNRNKDCPEEVLEKMELNEECRNVPYTLGRLFAVLEHIQQEANPGINATIKDKYFSAASATPARIFPKLIDLSEKHKRKLGEGSKIYFNKKIGELTEIIGTEFPMRLNLPQQGSFQLGYYYQTQKRYQKKEEK